ncbi:MAG: exodeoxyribonuclease I [Rubrivivax sp.]|nr:exodeoxyribonuclease I [Rubrivivax sp.]
MTAETFFWHDYETFGRDPRRDRPAQFAGLRTDGELNEVGEPVMWYCRPAPDVLPDPESCLLTGILPQQAEREGVAEHAFAARIEAELGRDGTIGVGYNSIRFDDEVTRHLFWRNLLDPYAREWVNGCGRWDLLDVVRCCWSLRPEGIVWPKYTEGELAGRPSFRLEDLARANALLHESAHDALSDVRATLALARLVRSHQPRLWDFCLRLRHKDAVRAEIGAGRPFLHISGRYPVERGCMAVVWPLAVHPTNKNEVIVWDLAHDPRELADLDAATLRQRLFTRSDALPEGVARLPVKTVHVNKSPIVIGKLRTAAAPAERWGLDLAQCERHAALAPAAAAAVASRWAEVYERPKPEHRPDVDEDLYGGFVGNEDRRTLARLRSLPPDRLAAARPAFHDGRLEELLFRYRARNFPESLADDERERWQQHCRERLLEGAGGALTVAAFHERVDALAEDAVERGDERAQALLEALLDHAEAIAPEPA